MIIRNLEYVNYRGLKTGTIDFDPRLTVVVGKNGSGKSSVLQAVATAVSWIVARIKSEKGIGQYIDDLSVTNGHQNAMPGLKNLETFLYLTGPRQVCRNAIPLI